MFSDAIQQTLSQLPGLPGVYRMYNAGGQLLYVGKAKNLKNRASSYFHQNGGHSVRIQSMIRQIDHFDYIVTQNEGEALILESNLIKQHRPKYNVLLKDDKRYPWLAMSDEAFPRLYVTRQPKKLGKTRFFGPYPNAGDMYRMLQIIRKHFPLRQRRTPLFKDRPCLNYNLGLCPAPCQQKITEADYQETIRQIELLLKGKTDELTDQLEREMATQSEALNFEAAARTRDKLKAVERIRQSQTVYVAREDIDEDVFACSRDGVQLVVTMLAVRKGKLLRVNHYPHKISTEVSTEEAFWTFLEQFYVDGPPGQTGEDDPLPDGISVPFAPDEETLNDSILAGWFTQVRGKNVTFRQPQKGVRWDLMQLARKNALDMLNRLQSEEQLRSGFDPAEALVELQEALGLAEPPHRMECFDISHIQGTETVASMVVFTDGIPDKTEYRKFKIQSSEGMPNDFESMEEVIRRRFKPENVQGNGKKGGWPPPDLLVIDGGKGQLSAALKGLKFHGLTPAEQPIVALAKQLEEIFQPEVKHSIRLPLRSAGLYLMQQIRDEAHRFAITFHRQRRGKRATQSKLDDIPGLGPRRKEKLLAVFQNVSGVMNANVVEIASALGMNQASAQKLYDVLHRAPHPTRDQK